MDQPEPPRHRVHDFAGKWQNNGGRTIRVEREGQTPGRIPFPVVVQFGAARPEAWGRAWHPKPDYARRRHGACHPAATRGQAAEIWSQISAALAKTSAILTKTAMAGLTRRASEVRLAESCAGSAKSGRGWQKLDKDSASLGSKVRSLGLDVRSFGLDVRSLGSELPNLNPDSRVLAWMS